MGRNHPGDLQDDEQERGREICGRKRPAGGASGSGHGRRPRRTFTTARWQRPMKPGEWWFRDGKEPVVEGVDFAFDTQDGPGEDLIFLGYSDEEGKEKVVCDDSEMVPDSLAPEVAADEDEMREEKRGSPSIFASEQEGGGGLVDHQSGEQGERTVVVASPQKERAGFVASDQEEGGGDLALDHGDHQEEGGGLARNHAEEQKERNGFLAEQDMAFCGREDIRGYSQADDELGWMDGGSPVEEFGSGYVVDEDMETQEQWVTDMLIKISPCYAKAVYRKRK